MRFDMDCFNEIAFGCQKMLFRSTYSTLREEDIVSGITASILLLYAILTTIATPLLILIAAISSIRSNGFIEVKCPGCRKNMEKSEFVIYSNNHVMLNSTWDFPHYHCTNPLCRWNTCQK